MNEENFIKIAVNGKHFITLFNQNDFYANFNRLRIFEFAIPVRKLLILVIDGVVKHKTVIIIWDFD